MRCLIVDDSAHFVDAARELLEHEGVTVVGVASTSADALRCFEESRPDVTLVDSTSAARMASMWPSNFTEADVRHPHR